VDDHLLVEAGVGVVVGAAADPLRVALGSPGRPGWRTGTLPVAAVTAGRERSSPVQPVAARTVTTPMTVQRNPVRARRVVEERRGGVVTGATLTAVHDGAIFTFS
jgi:hypothetical protein